jgi:hypothetical protein
MPNILQAMDNVKYNVPVMSYGKVSPEKGFCSYGGEHYGVVISET